MPPGRGRSPSIASSFVRRCIWRWRVTCSSGLPPRQPQRRHRSPWPPPREDRLDRDVAGAKAGDRARYQRRWASGLLVVGAVCLCASLLLPYWRMQVRAPQYPKGLALQVYADRVTGDVREIDTLNHYIGMRPLHEGARVERRLAVPGILITALCLLAAAAWGGRWSVLLVLPAIALPALFAADLFWWLREFGLNLDPHAPLNRAVKPFVPRLLGAGKIAQFSSEAWFGVGFYLATVAAACAAAAIWLRVVARRGTKMSMCVMLALWSCGMGQASAAMLEVGLPAGYPTIQAAVDAAADGDQIIVHAGRYAGPLIIAKSVELVGEGEPVLDGGGVGTVLEVAAPNVRVQGLTIRGSGDRLAADEAGIVVRAPDAVIEDNRLEDVLFGLDLRRAPRTVVRGNRLQGKALPVPRRGDLIRVWYSDDVRIEGNRTSGGRY